MRLLQNQAWRRSGALLLQALVIFAIAAVQFLFRRFDDNYLVGRFMVFSFVDPTPFFFALPAGLILAAFFSKIPLPARAHLPLLFFTAAAASVACWGVPETNPDVTRYFTQAKHLEMYGAGYFFKEWGRDIQVWLDLPVMPFLYGIIFKVFGETVIYIQAFLAVLFGLSAVLTGLIGKILWDEDTGLYAGWLLLGIPFLIGFTPMMLTDAPTMFFLTASAYLYIRAVKWGGTISAFGAVTAVLLTAFCKYSTWPMLSVLPVASLVSYLRAEGEGRRQVLKRSFAMLLSTFLLACLLAALKYDVVAEQIRLLLTYQRRGLGRWSDSYASTFLFQINPVVTVAAVFSLFVAAKKRDLNYLIVFWLVFLVFFFQVKRSRYTIPVFPMVTLMAAYGLRALKSREVKKALVACVVAASLVMCLFANVPFMRQLSAINLKEAGEFLDTLDVDAVEVFAVPQQEYDINPPAFVSILDLYTHKRIIFNNTLGASTCDGDWRRSPFRYTWEYRNPAYYSTVGQALPAKRAIAIIARYHDDVLPADVETKMKGFSHSKPFMTFFPVTSYHTVVTVLW